MIARFTLSSEHAAQIMHTLISRYHLAGHTSQTHMQVNRGIYVDLLHMLVGKAACSLMTAPFARSILPQYANYSSQGQGYLRFKLLNMRAAVVFGFFQGGKLM